MFDQDPNEQANISGADLATLIDELAEAKKLIEQLMEAVDELHYAEAIAAAKAFRDRSA